ncbi:MAG: DUF4954 domain-containing protein, partial [Armatimonadetes bacterium]|nr:DUF4954 domain-containing protein [Armatimonadota bacterium]
DNLTKEQWISSLNKAKEVQNFISDQVYLSRKKDFENPFRQATYRSMAEMTAAIGTIEDNSFVKQVQDETKDFKKLIEEIKKRN